MIEIVCKRCESRFNGNTRHIFYCDECRHNILLEKSKKHYDNNKERIQKVHTKWKNKNRNKVRKYSRDKFKRDYAENPQKCIDKVTAYRKTDNGKIMLKRLSNIWNRKRRANKAKIIEVFTQDEWNKKLDETQGICPSCKKFIGKCKLELDHIYPISKAEEGRIYNIDNVQPLCKSCNTIKGVKLN